jgi:hypothetical protein
MPCDLAVLAAHVEQGADRDRVEQQDSHYG